MFYSKETLEKRKQLQPQVGEETKKGNQITQKKTGTNKIPIILTKSSTETRRNEVIRSNILNYVEKTRSDPQLNVSKN